MPEYGFHLVLNPTAALRLLADVVAEADLRYLAEVQVQVSPSLLGAQAVIVVPDAHTQVGPARERQARQVLFDRLLQRAQELYPNLKVPRQLVEQDNASLAGALIQLLAHSGSAEDRVLPAEEEFLLVAQDIDVTRAAAICSDLRFHTTHARFITAEASMPGGEGQARAFLFHVRADLARKASFSSAVAGEFFPECAVLAAFASGERVIFLPEDATPGAAALRYFSQIVVAAPPLFGAPAVLAVHNLLLACDRPLAQQNDPSPARRRIWHQRSESNDLSPSAEPSRQAHLWYLAHLPFQSCVGLEPARPLQKADYQPVTLTLSNGLLSALRVRIEEAARRPEEYVGYRLELRPTQYQEWSDVTYEKLQTELVKLEYQIAYMESIARPRPRLLRFSQRQLPALADLLRSYPVSVLQRGELRYGFRADESGREGTHYLFVPPTVVNGEADPLVRWEHLDAMPMRFWIDPFWGKHYHTAPNQSLIFVPEGCTLFPSMHAWDVEDMDSYLREMMARWFHGRHGVSAIPSHPLYLFDGEPEPNAFIRISVLDIDQFQPLVTQLGWLNDNLIALDDLGVQPFIEQFAHSTVRRQLAELAEVNATGAEERFLAVARQTKTQLEAHTTQLAQSATQELETLIEETARTAETLQTLDKRLRELRAVRDEMNALANQAQGLIDRTAKEVTATDNDTARLQVKAQHAVERAARTRLNVDEKFTAEIEAIRRTRAALMQRLRSL
ncbi:MAG: hypothetical protein KF893_10005 [Caldilineaceae bacterium]|nr:hypothetical protein [Caldilineaceae bacterium]